MRPELYLPVGPILLRTMDHSARSSWQRQYKPATECSLTSPAPNPRTMFHMYTIAERRNSKRTQTPSVRKPMLDALYSQFAAPGSESWMVLGLIDCHLDWVSTKVRMRGLHSLVYLGSSLSRMTNSRSAVPSASEREQNFKMLLA